MSSIVHKTEFMNQLADTVLAFVKDKLEFMMREEISQFLHVEQPDIPNSRNGYYTRSFETQFGKIDDLRVPRDRQGEFQTQFFEPYQRRDGWLEEAVIRMYKGGMSTRDVASFIECVIGTHYSPTTVSNITNTVLEDVEAWRTRPLNKRYSVLYIDGIHFSLRRDSVATEVMYVAMGIDEEGYRQILGFLIGGNESAHGWEGFLKKLHARGATDILLGVFDGLVGLEEAFHRVYPKADVQRCVVHKIRNTFPKIRVRDKVEFLGDLKRVYTAPSLEEAQREFSALETKWSRIYPREIESWRADLPVLLTFYKYPEDIRERIYTTNAIERTIKEIRKRLKPMNSLPNIEAAEKIAYFVVTDYNDKWINRIIRGFGMPATRAKLQQMFQDRYGNNL